MEQEQRKRLKPGVSAQRPCGHAAACRWLFERAVGEIVETVCISLDPNLKHPPRH